MGWKRRRTPRLLFSPWGSLWLSERAGVMLRRPIESVLWV